MVVVDCKDGDALIERREFQPPVQLMSIPLQAKPLEEVLEEIALLPDGEANGESPYLEIKVWMSEPEPTYKYKIEEALKGKAVRLARIAAVLPSRTDAGLKTLTYEELQTIHPMDIAMDVYKRKYGGEDMPESMKKLLKTVIEEVRE